MRLATAAWASQHRKRPVKPSPPAAASRPGHDLQPAIEQPFSATNSYTSVVASEPAPAQRLRPVSGGVDLGFTRLCRLRGELPAWMAPSPDSEAAGHHETEPHTLHLIDLPRYDGCMNQTPGDGAMNEEARIAELKKYADALYLDGWKVGPSGKMAWKLETIGGTLYSAHVGVSVATPWSAGVSHSEPVRSTHDREMSMRLTHDDGLVSVDTLGEAFAWVGMELASLKRRVR